MNSIDREMSGDLKAGFKCIGKSHSSTSHREVFKSLHIDQSMPGRNWCTSGNSHMHPSLVERLFLIGIACAIHNLHI